MCQTDLTDGELDLEDLDLEDLDLEDLGDFTA